MPSRNVEVVRTNSAAFSRRDVDTMLGFYAPDAAVIDRRAVGWGEFRGHDALRAYYEGILDNAASLHEDLEVVSEDGDVVVATCWLNARLADQPDGPEVILKYALRFTLADGLITCMEIFEDANAATGLS